MTVILAALAALSALLLTPTPTPGPSSKPTFCVEWVRQSRPGYERVTLFADGTASM